MRTNPSLTRRGLLWATAAPIGVAAYAQTTTVSPQFPAQPPEVAHETVLVAHGNVKRLRELVDARPSLAKAAWDWGFGDWETALGAASHVGNREIAEYLIGKGAHPTIFSAAMLGQLEVVKAFVTAQPGVQRIAGPHSISLLAHARAGKTAAEPVLRYLETLGDAGEPAASPISDAEMKELTGIYTFGPSESDRIDISIVRGQLQFTRKAGTSRGLVHLGGKVFFPQGANAVRIRFAENTLTVHDPDPVITAKRVS